jgi:molecular chaperone DnaK
LKTALAGEDIEAVNTASDKLMQSQAKLGEAIYANAQAEPAADATTEASTEDVMDAEVIDEEEGEKKPGKKKTKDGE